jgi:peptide/nickel transport system ATP-binding protein
MAIALKPKLLIADEPTTALDVTTQAQILDLLKRLVAEDGMGLMLITHDLAVVADLADDLVIMKDGEVVESGPAGSLFANMRHPYSPGAVGGFRPCAGARHRPEPGPLLEVRDVVREYTGHSHGWWGRPTRFRAVDKVSFEIRKGESLGLVGESGCGKSTLTRAILGSRIQGGEILLDGLPVFTHHHANATVRRRMQVVFQDPYGSFNPRWTVGRLVAEPFHLLEDPPRGAERERPWPTALESVGLGGCGRGQVHPRILRRPAPAHRHCPGADHPAGADHPRRGGLGAGCLDPRPGARPPGRSLRPASDLTYLFISMTSASCAPSPTVCW